MRRFLITLVCAVSAAWMLSPTVAQAHGKLPNVQKYCEKKFNFKKKSLIGKIDRIDYFHDKKKRQWYCRHTYPHFQQGSASRIALFDPSDACKQTRKTRKVHYHEGIDVTSIHSMHCGIVDGTVSKDEGKKTMLSLCNKSRILDIYAVYAYWVRPSGNTQKGWSSTGWYKINQGQCRKVRVSNYTYDADVYVYAEGGGQVWGGNDAGFCVHSKKGFTIPNADKASCANAPYKRVRTTKFKVKPGNNTYNFRRNYPLAIRSVI